MKNSLYFALAASLLAFASCDDEDFTDWAAPTQIENAPGSVDAPEATVTEGGFINLAELPEGTTTVSLFKLTVSGCQLTSTVVKVSGTEYETDANGTFAVSDLENAIISAYGRAPEVRTLEAEVIGNVKCGENNYRMNYPIQIQAQLSAPLIESAYYLVGDMCGWSADAMLPFSHVGDGNVYDFPCFTVTFETTTADQYWKIIGQNGVDAGDIWSDAIGVAIDGDVSTEGYLTSNNPGAGKIEQPGKYKLTINMMEGTYLLETVKYEEFIYYIGATDGWTNAIQRLKLTDGENGVYTGFVYCADPNGWGNQFKFQQVPGDWSTEINSGNFTTFDGAATDCAGNIGVSGGESVYFFEVSLGGLSIKATEITNMNLVGDFNGWNAADDAQQMTWNADEFCYVMEAPQVTSAGWKFTANNDWAINLGGDCSNLTQDGANITMTGEIIKLYPCRTNSDNLYCKFGNDPLPSYPDFIYLPGNAQGWSPATAPALAHQGGGFFTGFAYMDGEFKFTQERAWAAEYNNSSFSTVSEGFDLGNKDGGNINCSVSGVYYFEVNVATGDLKATLINNMNLVGDFNGWNAADDAQQMTWNADELCYEISGAGVNANGWKFTANNDWGINLGGSVDNLSQNGDNLSAEGGNIKLYPCRTTGNNIYCTVE